MPSTLRVTPVTQFMRHYIARHRTSINPVGQLLGVPPIAIASALTEEMRNVYPDHGTKAPTDMIADQLVIGLRSHGDLAKDFSERLADIVVGAKPSLEQKLLHATANDIGPGNINLGQAILELRRYLRDPANASDPMRLRPYADDYKTFARDLISLNSAAPSRIRRWRSVRS